MPALLQGLPNEEIFLDEADPLPLVFVDLFPSENLAGFSRWSHRYVIVIHVFRCD